MRLVWKHATTKWDWVEYGVTLGYISYGTEWRLGEISNITESHSSKISYGTGPLSGEITYISESLSDEISYLTYLAGRRD